MRGLIRAFGVCSAVVFLAAASGVARSQEAPKPGKEHKVLESELGTWDAVIKTWSDPKGEPAESKGVETNTMMPGGLWLLSEFKGEFFGSEFHGRGQYGYDTNKKKYVGTWIDSMTSSLMVSEGTYDEKTHAMTMTGDMFDPAAGKEMKTKSVTVIKPDGTRTMTMYVMAEGTGPEGFKMMEISYKKRK